jgi:hypothetical protein
LVSITAKLPPGAYSGGALTSDYYYDPTTGEYQSLNAPLSVEIAADDVIVQDFGVIMSGRTPAPAFYSQPTKILVAATVQEDPSSTGVITSASIAGKPVTIGAGGAVSALVALHAGTNRVTISATDSNGKKMSWTRSYVVGVDTNIAMNFNGTAIKAGSTLWLNAVFKPSGLGTAPVTLRFQNGTVKVGPYTVPVPNAEITLNPNAIAATTTFNSSTQTWVTVAPPNLSGNYFLAAVAFPVPSNLAGGLKANSWDFKFTSDTPGVSVSWQWGAAVYTHFASDYSSLGVKPIDDGNASRYQNSDLAGTPESYKAYVTGGASGGGGSNWTGGYSRAAPVN